MLGFLQVAQLCRGLLRPDPFRRHAAPEGLSLTAWLISHLETAEKNRRCSNVNVNAATTTGSGAAATGRGGDQQKLPTSATLRKNEGVSRGNVVVGFVGASAGGGTLSPQSSSRGEKDSRSVGKYVGRSERGASFSTENSRGMIGRWARPLLSDETLARNYGGGYGYGDRCFGEEVLRHPGDARRGKGRWATVATMVSPGEEEGRLREPDELVR